MKILFFYRHENYLAYKSYNNWKISLLYKFIYVENTYIFDYLAIHIPLFMIYILVDFFISYYVGSILFLSFLVTSYRFILNSKIRNAQVSRHCCYHNENSFRRSNRLFALFMSMIFGDFFKTKYWWDTWN